MSDPDPKYKYQLRGFTEEERREFLEKKRQLKAKQEACNDKQQKLEDIQRLREQLELEKKERIQKLKESKGKSVVSSEASSSSSSSSSNQQQQQQGGDCLLQIRLPDGSTTKQSFNGNQDTIQTVHDFVSLQCGSRDFILLCPYPKREFSNEESMRLTLAAANLTPRAQLVAQRTSTRGVVARGEGAFPYAPSFSSSSSFPFPAVPPPPIPLDQLGRTDEGLTFEQLSKIKVSRFDSQQQQQQQPVTSNSSDSKSNDVTGRHCVLCDKDYQDNDEVLSLPCSHCLHKQCGYKFFRNHVTCPFCRKVLTQWLAANHNNNNNNE